MRPHGSSLELERRRRLAVQRISDGYRPSEVARFLGVNDASVRRWVQAFHKYGEKGLAPQCQTGRPQKLTKTQEKIVLRWLDDNPVDHGFPTELWTGARLRQLIQEEFGIRFNPNYLSAWLRKRGYTPQMPQRIPRQRDPEAIQKWISSDWPRIKKKRRKNAPTSFL